MSHKWKLTNTCGDRKCGSYTAESRTLVARDLKIHGKRDWERLINVLSVIVLRLFVVVLSAPGYGRRGTCAGCVHVLPPCPTALQTQWPWEGPSAEELTLIRTEKGDGLGINRLPLQKTELRINKGLGTVEKGDGGVQGGKDQVKGH